MHEESPQLNSIGLVLVGGMFVGAIFTLFIVPSIYMLIARDHGNIWLELLLNQQKAAVVQRFLSPKAYGR